MNTTPFELPSQATPTHSFLKGEFVASQIRVGDLYMHSKGVVRVTDVWVNEDGATVICWDGGRTMCEPGTVLRFQPETEATC